MTEEELLNGIIDQRRGLAPLLGWKTLHIRPGMVLKDGEVSYRTPVSGDGAGFPDLLLVRPPRIVIAELKSKKGEPSPEQTDWLDILSKVTHPPEVFLWRPSDINEIVDVLRHD